MSGSFVHNSIMTGCRRLAGHLPSSPHQEGHHAARRSLGSVEYFPTPYNHRPSSLAGGPPCRHLYRRRGRQAHLTTPESLESSSSATGRSATTPREVASRLREILRIREAAYRSRNPDLLRSIYSSDCPCLASDEKAITSCCNARTCGMGSRRPSR